MIVYGSELLKFINDPQSKGVVACLLLDTNNDNWGISHDKVYFLDKFPYALVVAFLEWLVSRDEDERLNMIMRRLDKEYSGLSKSELLQDFKYVIDLV